MTNLFDALEFCLQEVERGADIESVLARFPEHAAELRPILKTAAKARTMTAAEPSPEIMRRSRARVLQHAAELRESQVAPKKRHVIPMFQRLAISFALAAIFLLSGNGLLSASASALPGERLYPVKRGWESIRLFFIFDQEARELLKNEFENERLHEVNELLTEGRHEVIEFAGVFMQVNGLSYVSGLQIILPAGMPLPANGDAVIVSGRTNAQGFIEIISLELLPDGSVVPSGNPIEMEIESDSDEVETPPAIPSSGSGNEAVKSTPQELEVKGTLQAVSTTELVINGMKVYLDNSKIEGQLCVGMEVEVKGYYAADGRFIVKEVKGKGECSGGAPSGVNSSSNSGSNNNDENNTSGSNNNSDDDNNDNDNDDDSDDDSDDGDSDDNDD
jgi:hypothetical protein